MTEEQIERQPPMEAVPVIVLKTFTIGQVAEIIGVSISTIRKWMDTDTLRASGPCQGQGSPLLFLFLDLHVAHVGKAFRAKGLRGDTIRDIVRWIYDRPYNDKKPILAIWPSDGRTCFVSRDRAQQMVERRDPVLLIDLLHNAAKLDTDVRRWEGAQEAN